MNKLLSSLFLSSVIFMSGCDSIDYLMTYKSPTGATAAELDQKFQKLSRADNVFDGAVVVRGEIDDDHDFDEKSKVYPFDTGLSVFRTYSLPLNATNLNIRNVFFKFSLNNFSAGENAIAYMVIYTTDADLTTETTITHPAKLYAIAHKTEVPNLTDPKIPHARLGHIDVKINLEASTGDALADFWNSLKGPLWGGSDRTVIADVDDGAVATDRKASTNIRTADGKGVVVVNPNKDGSATAKPANAAAEVLGETKSASAKKGSMMKETEEMYNNMIRSAVKSGDISKAMKLAAEATNAGSATANATLNSALQSRK